MKAHDNSNVIAFPLAKVNKARVFNVLDAEWRSLKKGEGKRVSDREIQTLWTIIRLANHYQTSEIKIDYSFLMKQCAFGCSQDQMRRYLKGLKETKIITYKIENEQHNYEKKLVISIDTETLKSLLPSMFAGQVCTANLPTHNKEENKFKNKEKERALKSYLSFSKKEKINNKKEKDETPLSLAATGFDEPAAKEEFLSAKQEPKQAEIPRAMTTEEEQEHYRNHIHRTPSTATGESFISELVNEVCRNLGEQKNETSAQQKGVEFQPKVENSPSSSPPETIIPTRKAEEMEQKKEVESVTNCHQLNEINPNWQRIKDLAIALCTDRVDKMDIRCTLNELVAVEDAAEKKFYLNGDSLNLQMLHKTPWKTFNDAFHEILPDYKLELKEVKLKELEQLRSSDLFADTSKKVASAAPQAESKPAPVRYVSMFNPSPTPLWDFISEDFKQYYGENHYKSWLSKADVTQDFNNRTLKIKVQSLFYKERIETDYLHKLTEFMTNHASDYKIKVEVK